jgi:hypothetical protein
MNWILRVTFPCLRKDLKTWRYDEIDSQDSKNVEQADIETQTK